jgi:hypothetical protein
MMFAICCIAWKVGEKIGDNASDGNSSRRKYCTVCEQYFGKDDFYILAVILYIQNIVISQV